MALTLATAGQLLLHGPIETASDAAGTLRAALSDAAAFSNFEATVETPGAWATKTKTLHLASPEALDSVRALGFRAISHANNHAFDLGPPGLSATRRAAEAAGLAFTGSGVDADAALAPALVDQPGGRIAVLAVDLGPQPDIAYADGGRPGIARLGVHRVVVLPPHLRDALREIDDALGDGRRASARAAVGYQPAEAASGFTLFGTRFEEGATIAERYVPDPADMARVAAAIADARRGGAVLCAVVLHSHHWDADWTRTPDWCLALARSLIDAGADCIVGHGAPVLQGMAMHRGKPILAGLGNCIFHTRRGDVYRREGVDVFRSVVVRLRFSDTGTCLAIEAMPIAVGEGRPDGGPSPAPVPLAGDEAEGVMERFVGQLPAAARALVTRRG